MVERLTRVPVIDEPQQMADELVAQVRVLGGNRMRDDLAILAIRILGERGDRA